jgi:G patch domain and KOW motifs-containing protein
MADADGGGGGAQLKFGFAKTVQQRKVAVQVAEKKDDKRLITGIDGSVIKTLEPEPEQEAKKVYIVPKLENTYRTGVGKKFTPTFKPPANDAPIGGEGEDRFVAATEDSRPVITQYGLEERARPAGADEDAPPISDRPLLNGAQLEHEAYKRDMEELPDTAPVEVGDPMQLA